MSELLFDYYRKQILTEKEYTHITFEVMIGEHSYFDYSIEKTEDIKGMSDIQILMHTGLVSISSDESVLEESGLWFEQKNGKAIRIINKKQIDNNEKKILDKFMRY